MTLRERQVWQSVFSTMEGKAVLTAMLNRLGYYSSNPSLIDPNLIAYANWMLSQIGVVTVDNLTNLTNAVVGSASNNDLQE